MHSNLAQWKRCDEVRLPLLCTCRTVTAATAQDQAAGGNLGASSSNPQTLGQSGSKAGTPPWVPEGGVRRPGSVKAGSAKAASAKAASEKGASPKDTIGRQTLPVEQQDAEEVGPIAARNSEGSSRGERGFAALLRTHTANICYINIMHTCPIANICYLNIMHTCLDCARIAAMRLRRSGRAARGPDAPNPRAALDQDVSAAPDASPRHLRGRRDAPGGHPHGGVRGFGRCSQTAPPHPYLPRECRLAVATRAARASLLTHRRFVRGGIPVPVGACGHGHLPHARRSGAAVRTTHGAPARGRGREPREVAGDGGVAVARPRPPDPGRGHPGCHPSADDELLRRRRQLHRSST